MNTKVSNKIIAFANMKGGVGKTSLCIALANYLTLAKVPVVVVDADLQQSIATLRHQEEESDNFKGQQAPWRVLSMRTNYNISNMDDVIGSMRKELQTFKSVPATFLIDCPGNASDDCVKYIYNAADIIVIPMDYSPITVNSTVMFAKDVLQKMKNDGLINAKLYFQPNKYEERRKQLNREEVKSRLKQFGYLGTRVNNRSEIVKISTFSFPARVKGYFKYPFEDLTKFVYGEPIIL